MSDIQMAAVWLVLAVVVTLLGMYAGYRMGRARNEWERRRFEKIEEENRTLRRELTVARVKADGAARLLEVTESQPVVSRAEPATEPAAEPKAEAEVVIAAEPEPETAPAPSPVLDLRRLTKSDIDDVVIDLTDGAAQYDAEEVARLEALLMREIDHVLTDAEA